MIIEETIGKWIDGTTDLISRKSDDPGKQLNKVGTTELYEEAVDLSTSPVEYREVDKPVTSEPSDGEQGEDSPTQPNEEVD